MLFVRRYRTLKELDFETAMLILEKLDPISVTNACGEYIYANSSWLEKFGTTLNKLTGIHPWDIIPDTRVNEVLETKQPIIAHAVKNINDTAIVSYYPITKKNDFFGVLVMVLFSEMEIALKVSNQVTRLSKELEAAKAKLRNLSTTTYSIGNIIGDSQAILNLRKEIISAARTNSTVKERAV